MIQKLSCQLVVICSLLGSLVSCSNVEKVKPQPTPARVETEFKPDVPEIMKGTVASEAIVIGYENPNSRNYRPVIARGYGLVVGLKGKGSRNIPPPIRAFMIAEASKGGFGGHQHGDEVASITPEALLDSLDTAVVTVEAVIPQGAVKGERFDVRVSALATSDVQSLEGGTLYTTQLRPGIATTGGAQAFPLAIAKGEVFVNPFAEPNAIAKDSVNRTVGRILNGGEVTKDMPLKLRLINPSHSRASIIVSAINTKFPQEFEFDQKNPTARGESDSSIELTVPPSFRGKTDEFIELLRHTTIIQNNPEVIAMSIRRTLISNPSVAKAASLRWQALGPRGLPIMKELYDHAEELPRLAALRAGAKLDDALVIPHLVSMIKKGSPDARVESIQLLAGLQSNPQVDLELRKLIDDDDIEVRLQAYEALAKRRDPYLDRAVVGDRFVLDVVDSQKPLVYITQTGQPRIVLFGPDVEIERPSAVTAWSNRLMLRADSADPQIEVYFRPEEAVQGVIVGVDPKLSKFIEFLGHTTTIEKPDPGLGLSYSYTVGAIHEIWRQKGIKADFRAEQDRILAAIMRQSREDSVEERPEFSPDPTLEEFNSAPGMNSDLGRLEQSVSHSPTMPQTNR